MQNLQLDPQKKDYVINSAGSPVPTDDVRVATYFAITIPEDNWLYGVSGQGSKLFTLNNVKRTGSTEQQIASFTSDAINRQVIATGLASAEQFKNIEVTRSGTLDTISVTPIESKVSDQFSFVAV